MKSDERQLASMPDAAPRRPQHWKRLMQVVLTLCVCILTVGFAFNIQVMGMLSGAIYLVLYFVTSLAGFEVYMVVGFILAVRAMRQYPAFRSGNPGSRSAFDWGARLALASLVPLAVGYFGFFWYEPSLRDIWRPPNNEFEGFFVLLGAALVLFCIGIVLLCVTCIWAMWQRVRSVVRGPSGNSNA